MTGVADWIGELQDPACYPHGGAPVEIVQTHISVVCLCGEHVYKLKKAVHLPFVDFSTFARREHFCREELRLNRRLCADVYLDVVPLRRTAQGLRFEAGPGGGEIVEVAVHMRRLPAARMLDRLVQEHAVGADDLAALARHLAAFHARADRGPDVLAAGAPERLCGFARANFDELDAVPGHGLSGDLLRALRERTDRDCARLLPVLRERAAAGRVVDGHGDLHTRNICMVQPPAIYDCIEFEAGFRCGDVANEVAFLAMDLRYRDALPLARAFVAAYAEAARDPQLPALLPPLLRYRAIVRAKVAAIAAAEAELPATDREAARASAARHLALAAATAVEEDGPLWLLLCGPPASGKSNLAAVLARAGSWPLLSTDRVRKELAGLPATARAAAEHYTAAFSDRTYGELRRRAAAMTARGDRVVVLDGNFPSPARRAEARTAAATAGAALHVLQLRIDERLARQRVAARARDPGAVSDAGPEQFDALWARFRPPSPAEGIAITPIDGALPPAAAAGAAFAALLDRPGAPMNSGSR